MRAHRKSDCYSCEPPPRPDAISLPLLASSSLLIMSCRWSDLASKDGVADGGVEQHQREDENTRSPEHECETGMGCGSFVDGDRERDHVRPERDRQGPERCRENERDHVEWCSVLATLNACGRHERRDDTDRREDKQIRPLDPSAHDPKVFGQ